ncbi:MAG TPA: hypothetical protein VMA54_17990 [Steroidobacteraceae bacterium]|nr:hypothetical protein [Steroidobacteraceae bacterium]
MRIATPAGMAAATIIKHGMAAHTNSPARDCPGRSRVSTRSRVLQMETSIVAKMPTVKRADNAKTTMRMIASVS